MGFDCDTRHFERISRQCDGYQGSRCLLKVLGTDDVTGEADALIQKVVN